MRSSAFQHSHTDHAACNGFACARDKGVFFVKGEHQAVKDGDVLDIVHGA